MEEGTWTDREMCWGSEGSNGEREEEDCGSEFKTEHCGNWKMGRKKAVLVGYRGGMQKREGETERVLCITNYRMRVVGNGGMRTADDQIHPCGYRDLLALVPRAFGRKS